MYCVRFEWKTRKKDDSCYEYGTSILVNGKELVREASIMTAVQSVLKELGIEADIKEVCENKCCDAYKK
ncbi:hypothetical protein DT075_27165 [Bacillus licheniformis]|nr:hypothetical protein DT075_27165 [Bacillus licheniformis]